VRVVNTDREDVYEGEMERLLLNTVQRVVLQNVIFYSHSR
jgi:hypothetical protein